MPPWQPLDLPSRPGAVASTIGGPVVAASIAADGHSARFVGIDVADGCPACAMALYRQPGSAR